MTSRKVFKDSNTQNGAGSQRQSNEGTGLAEKGGQLHAYFFSSKNPGDSEKVSS